MPDLLITRREGLRLAGLAASVSAAPALAQRPRIDFVSKIDFKSPEWNRDTLARIDSDIDTTKQKLGWLKGKVYGVRPNEAVRTLFGFEGFSLVRTHRLADGSWRRLLRETILYRDLETGQILKTWRNPYTNEDVRVVPIANNSYNTTISAYSPDGKPQLAEWMYGPDNTIILELGVNLFYTSALAPEKWVRESSGAYNQVTELFTYTLAKADVANPDLTHIPQVGSWQRITPWLPWMLMGTAPGHTSYFGTFRSIPGGVDGLKDLPQDLVEAARAYNPLMLSAPTEDNLPNESSLEAYAKQQKPAPVPAGWTPPQPPVPPTYVGSAADLGNQKAAAGDKSPKPSKGLIAR